MKKMLPVIVLITLLPTVCLVAAAVYVGSHLLSTTAEGAEKTRFESTSEGNLASQKQRLQEKTQEDDSQVDPQSKEQWIKLFDGKSTKGWEGNLKFFRVDQGAIVAGNLKKAIPRNEFLCTEQSFQDFELRLQARLLGEGKNAGVQFRSRRVPKHHEMIGYQCDMGQMNGHSIWGFLYDESRRRKFLAQADFEKNDKNTKTGKWNDLVIRCQGKRVQIWVNGFQTVDYVEQDKKIEASGVIGLQIHSGAPAEAWYRDIRIKKLN